MQGSKYNDSVRAQVLADGELGKTSVSIGRERNLPTSTVGDWLRDAREKAMAENRDPLLVSGEYRRAFMAQQLIEEGMQQLKESGEPLHKYLVPLNIIAGTAIDKVMKSQEKPNIQAQNVTINVYGEPPPMLIEGEVSDA